MKKVDHFTILSVSFIPIHTHQANTPKTVFGTWKLNCYILFHAVSLNLEFTHARDSKFQDWMRKTTNYTFFFIFSVLVTVVTCFIDISSVGKVSFWTLRKGGIFSNGNK